MMRFVRRFAVVAMVAAGLTTLAGMPGFIRPSFAQQAVSTQREDQTVVALSAYGPAGGRCQGIALISPGAGGSEQGYRFIGEALAADGYLAVVMNHPESGREAVQQWQQGRTLRDALAGLLTTPQAYRGRAMDIRAARRWAGQHCQSGEHILLGHSMGAATVMIEAGARNKVQAQGSDAFKAYVALSPQGVGMIFPDDAWSGIRKPVLLITGTRDIELGSGTWQSRTEPFGNLPPGCKWLGIVQDATHMNFAGRGEGSADVTTATVATIRAFLGAVRRGDCATAVQLPGIDITLR